MQATGRARTSNEINENELPFEDGVNDLVDRSGTDTDSDLDDDVPEQKEKSKRPPDNNFSQQRLKAVNPVFTARTVIPILLLLGVFLVPLGAAMWLASSRIEDILIEYTQCENEASRDHWSSIPEEYLLYHLKDNANIGDAQWMLATDETQADEDEMNVCKIQFEIPHRIKGPLYLFYRLKNFHQNHRRYVKSFSEDQLNGKAASVSVIKDTVGLNCEPLSLDEDGNRIYPCGLIANSLFNDTYSSTLEAVNGTSTSYNMSNDGIAWSTNKNRFKKTEYNYEDIVPPPNWIKKFPDGYNSTNVPDILTWAEFQNWMFTSAFADFHKLALKNDNDAIDEGTYEISIGLHFPVLPYDGKKYIFLSQRSVLGGKNYFLGYVWIASGGVCIILGLVLLIVNMLMPRRAGDVNLLSWNREAITKDEK
ncbi:Lem3/Cdc50 [Metschnikowia bicuspidata var. bicuspidata NRRL YB-4993]|uniref:Lem3/Cdc50 n=1 Tax=Metschnikowia bicuspidata var. bicuspidata NRRL YB-4993 TaxID=869754 RepID=A0A1A0H9C4_9ASCO|nr:Lem3/Cdc50 [Metschnikowia bicuspidata var. bicuspidata NRRL YB-4993]OBA20487.1 Lem3/Cdc50 [Metschnikowia bicuspidata var. bicuspidata NRRL YB-4993]